MEDATTIPLASRRRERMLLFQQLQHAVPSVALLMSGLRGLQAGHEGLERALALAEVAAGALVIGAAIRSLRRVMRAHDAEAHAHHGIDRLDIFLAAMLAIEAFSHQHRTGHLPRPTILLAVVMLGLGLLHGPLAARRARRRSLKVDDAGLTVGGRFFTRFTAQWPDIDRIDISERHATIHTRDGRTKKINLDDLRNREDVTAALERAAAKQEARNKKQESQNPEPEP